LKNKEAEDAFAGTEKKDPAELSNEEAFTIQDIASLIAARTVVQALPKREPIE